MDDVRFEGLDDGGERELDLLHPGVEQAPPASRQNETRGGAQQRAPAAQRGVAAGQLLPGAPPQDELPLRPAAGNRGLRRPVSTAGTGTSTTGTPSSSSRCSSSSGLVPITVTSQPAAASAQADLRTRESPDTALRTTIATRPRAPAGPGPAPVPLGTIPLTSPHLAGLAAGAATPARVPPAVRRGRSP